MTTSLTDIIGENADLIALATELRSGLELFWRVAADILDSSGIRLISPDESTLSLQRNFFSALFLYSYYRCGIPTELRILYVALNQCLRGMVTGCDNLLDDEYKTTLQTNLPAQAHRFRSVLDIMVADRVLFSLLTDHCRKLRLSPDLALKASKASLQALTQSGAQEASEEGGIAGRLPPASVLRDVHHFKTGLLFQSVWAVPDILAGEASPAALEARSSLYRIGIGCQILDDIVDLGGDLRENRHNYVASVIFHEEEKEIARQCTALLAGSDFSPTSNFYRQCPDLLARMKDRAFTHLCDGLHGLFFDRHQAFVEPAAQFIAGRIGIDTLISAATASPCDTSSC